MFSKILSSLTTLLSAFLPLSAFAATKPEDFKGLVKMILENIFTPLVALIIGFAFVTFLWGVYQYISNPETHARGEGRKAIVYGLVGLFVMLSVWGLVQILTATFGIPNVIPQLQSQ